MQSAVYCNFIRLFFVIVLVIAVVIPAVILIVLQSAQLRLHRSSVGVLSVLRVSATSSLLGGLQCRPG